MRSHRWRSIQSGLPESAHGSPELVKHALLVEADGMSCNTPPGGQLALKSGQLHGRAAGSSLPPPDPMGPAWRENLDLVSWRMVLRAEGSGALWPWESGEAQMEALRPR